MQYIIYTARIVHIVKIVHIVHTVRTAHIVHTECTVHAVRTAPYRNLVIWQMGWGGGVRRPRGGPGENLEMGKYIWQKHLDAHSIGNPTENHKKTSRNQHFGQISFLGFFNIFLSNVS